MRGRSVASRDSGRRKNRLRPLAIWPTYKWNGTLPFVVEESATTSFKMRWALEQGNISRWKPAPAWSSLCTGSFCSRWRRLRPGWS